MSKKYSWGISFLACALAVGWLLTTPAFAVDPGDADFPDREWNLELVGTGLAGVPLSKLAPWPRTDGHFFYSGGYHQTAPGTFWIIDVKDKFNPVGISYPVYDPIQSRLPPEGHPIWTSDAYNYTNDPANLQSPCGDWVGVDYDDPVEVAAVVPTCWDPGWITRTHFTGYGTGKILAVNAQRRRGSSSNRIGYTGVSTWDVHDPQNAKLLDIWNAPYGRDVNGDFDDNGGCHHFFYDGRYLYGGCNYAGFDNRILVILDLHDPENIVEVGRWWVPGQMDGEPKTWVNNGSFSNTIETDPGTGKLKKYVGLHYVAVQGNIAYLSYHQAGLIILDVTDKTNPQFLSRLDYMTPAFQADEPDENGAPTGVPSPDYAACNRAGQPGTYPKACGNAHSGKLVPGAGGLLAMTDEYFRCPYGHLRLIDVSNPTMPFIITHKMLDPLPGEAVSRTIDCSWTDLPGGNEDAYTQRTPSTHLPTAVNNNMLFIAWYGAGVRAVDVSNPYEPKEVGAFQYNIPGGGAATYDVLFGPGGLLYSSDSVDGVRVLKYTGTGKSGKIKE